MSDMSEALRDAFVKAEVKSVAIVDDGYDEPTAADLDEQRWLAFVEAAEEDGVGSPHADLLSKLGPLPSFNDVRPTTLATIWHHHHERALSSDPADEPVGTALEALFRSFSTAKLGKLRQLRFVEQAAERGLGRAPLKLPSGTNGQALAGHDLVFLDYFLGDEAERGEEAHSTALMDKARSAACDLVRQTSMAAHPSRTPLFVLISSLADATAAPEFRDEAQFLASKFRFLSKNEIEFDQERADYVVIELLRQRPAADAVERFQAEWVKALRDAEREMMASVRRLDVPEYSYLHHYRLADEKTSLIGYLAWLYNGYLGG